MATGSVEFISASRQLKISFEKPANIILKNKVDHDEKYFQIFILIEKGSLQNGQSIAKTFTIKASGVIDKNPVTLIIDTSKPGKRV